MGRSSCVRVLTLCLVAGSAGLSSADTYPRQPGIDIAHYVFRLILRDETDAIEGEHRNVGSDTNRLGTRANPSITRHRI